MPRREPESEEQRQSRLVRQKINYLKRRTKETPEERQHRLKKMCDSHKRKRRNESSEERAARLEKAKIKNMKYIQNETPEQRERRLNRLKTYYRQRLTNETPEERELRLMKGRISQKKKNVNETPERREKRLNKLRDYQKKKLENETPQQREYRLNRLKNNQKRRQTKDDVKEEEYPNLDEKDTRIEIAYLERQHLIDQHLLQDDFQNDSEDLAQKNPKTDHSNENLSNGIMIKQELIMDDTSNDDRSQDICLPVITCVKSEYDGFTSREFEVQVTNIKCEFECISYDKHTEEEDFDDTNGIDDTVKSFSTDNALNDTTPDTDKCTDTVITPEIKEETEAIENDYLDFNESTNKETEPESENVINLSENECEDMDENDLLVPRAVKIVKVVEQKSNKKKIIEKTNNTKPEHNTNNVSSLPPIQCRICSKIFKYVKPFKKHEESHNITAPAPPSEPVPINIDLPFTRSNTLHTQIMSEDDTKPQIEKPQNGVSKNTCNCWCGISFETKKRLIECFKTHGGFMCDLCPNTFRIKIDLDAHNKEKHAGSAMKIFACNVCSKTFVHRKAFLMHRRKHTLLDHRKKQANKITTSKAVSETPLSNPTKIRMKCTFCPMLLENASALKIHVALTHGKADGLAQVAHICRICHYCFPTVQALKEHEKSHIKYMGKYKCNRCEFASHNTKSLSQHRRLHCRGVRPPEIKKPTVSQSLEATNRLQYTCDVCGRPFNSQVQMIRHKNTHPFITFAEDDLTQKQIFYK